MTAIHVGFVLSELQRDPTLYLFELQKLILAAYAVNYSLACISQTLRRAKLTSKQARSCLYAFSRLLLLLSERVPFAQLQRMALQRDSAERGLWLQMIRQYSAECFVVIDETRKDPISLRRRRGRARRGQRAFARVSMQRTRGFSALGVLTVDGMIDCAITQSSGVSSDEFLTMLTLTVVRSVARSPSVASSPS